MAPEEPPVAPPELIIVVQPEAGVRVGREGLTAAAADVSSLANVLAEAGAQLLPLFGLSEQRLSLEAQAPTPTGIPSPDLSVYYRVEVEGDLEELAERLREEEVVQAAFVKPPAQLAQADEDEEINVMTAAEEDAPPVTPDFSGRQGYLNAAPVGIDARFAWTVPGGEGTGVNIVDIEAAWRFTHEDLLQSQGGVIGGTESSDLSWRNHGTAVIGEFGGDRNGIGVLGICPQANVRAVSIFGPTIGGTAGAIRRAAQALSAGDIILIELHRPGPQATGSGQFGFIAIEWWPDDFDAILFATSRGVVVVEAAGNGSQNLDDPVYNNPQAGFPATWRNPFNRANRDSGAVVVGAGAPPPGTHGRDHGPDRSRLGFSNYGSMVDAQGWGREVTTTGYGDLQGGPNEDLWYTDTFSGTSSASPIVVGALGCVQGVARARPRAPLTPAQARQFLRATGSPQQDAPDRPATQRIGNRPDLRALINRLLKPAKEKNEQKDRKDSKEAKEVKDKERKNEKERPKERKEKDQKEQRKDAKERKETGKDAKERRKERKDHKELTKEKDRDAPDTFWQGAGEVYGHHAATYGHPGMYGHHPGTYGHPGDYGQHPGVYGHPGDYGQHPGVYGQSAGYGQSAEYEQDAGMHGQDAGMHGHHADVAGGPSHNPGAVPNPPSGAVPWHDPGAMPPPESAAAPWHGHFIGPELRPDLVEGALGDEPDAPTEAAGDQPLAEGEAATGPNQSEDGTKLSEI